MTFVYAWLVVLTLALAAHMFKDAGEFKKIKRLEEEIEKNQVKP